MRACRHGLLASFAILFLLPLARAAESVEMLPIPGGEYARPLEEEGKTRLVKPFLLDSRQVTNAEFLEFVKAQPKWQRSNVASLFAAKSYLSHWAGDTELGPLAPPGSPVVNVSWFAAKAYLASVGKRLPTVDEWEFAARASTDQADATGDPKFREIILNWYSRPGTKTLPHAGSMPKNYYGISGMHGLVWEWTLDFVSSTVGAESRSDGTPQEALFCGAGATNPNQAKEYATFMRLAFRSSLSGSSCLSSLGFRGAKDAPEKHKNL